MIHLKSLNWLSMDQLDDIQEQYESLISDVNACACFKLFDHRGATSVDTVFYNICNSNVNFFQTVDCNQKHVNHISWPS